MSRKTDNKTSSNLEILIRKKWYTQLCHVSGHTKNLIDQISAALRSLAIVTSHMNEILLCLALENYIYWITIILIGHIRYWFYGTNLLWWAEKYIYYVPNKVIKLNYFLKLLMYPISRLWFYLFFISISTMSLLSIRARYQKNW